jgi:hypothetical protein
MEAATEPATPYACDQCDVTVRTENGLKLHQSRMHGKVPGSHVCAEPGCETLLSRFNKGDHCAVHTRKRL